MDFANVSAMTDEITALFGGKMELKECDTKKYGYMRWPKLLPIMRFEVKQYAAPYFGNVFSMATAALGGKMQLATFVCTPNLGADVPLMLIDVMAMGTKHAAFIEYYDCTELGVPAHELRKTAEQFASLEDYPEKPAWYVGRRAPYSLIKGGVDGGALADMLTSSVKAYACECCACHSHDANRTGLSEFIERMVRDGNPSSGALERALGKQGAEVFFRSIVMPATYCPAI
jgi:hypothetical protein